MYQLKEEKILTLDVPDNKNVFEIIIKYKQIKEKTFYAEFYISEQKYKFMEGVKFQYFKLNNGNIKEALKLIANTFFENGYFDSFIKKYYENKNLSIQK